MRFVCELNHPRHGTLVFAAVYSLLSTPLLVADETFTPRHVAAIRAVETAVISPDGANVAYVLGVPRDPYAQPEGDETFEDGPAWEELHVVLVASKESRPFIQGRVNVSAPAWRPRRQELSFLAKRSGDEHVCLYVIPLEGGEARRVVSHETDVTAYSWSPDGQQVAFLATRKLDEKKKKLQDRGFVAEVFEEDPAPVRVWTARPDVAKDQPRALELPGSAVAVEWSPAGGLLAVVISPTSLVDDKYMHSRVYLVDDQSGEVRHRFDNQGKLGQVEWSPDGRYLAMITAADMNDPSEGRLSIASTEAQELRDLLPDYLGHVSRMAWQDADTVMFLGDEGVGTAFGKVDVDASGQKSIVSPGDVAFTGLSLSEDGMQGAFVGSSASHPAEVFFMRHGDDGLRRLTDSNPRLADLRLAPQEVVEFQARDGLSLQGILIRPLDEEKGRRYPLILYVHGGPESNERNGWLTNYSRPGQLAAARGFAVFYPNYRGSTGRGVAFSKLSQADEAGKEFDDLVDAVMHLVSTGLVDEDKVGITGGSYGGYASAWGATALSEHFAAAVMFVGISDSIAKKGTTDIPNEDYLVHTRDRPWNGRWQFYLERSPIFHVQKCRTPLLILAGKNDTRVHPSQSLELYRFLKILGQAPVRLVLYPGEGHGNRKAASRLDYNLRMMQWMEHYLKGPGGPPPPFDPDYGFEDTPADKPPATAGTD